MLRISFYVLLLQLLLGACSTQKNSLKSDEDIKINRGESYLLIGVDTTFPLESIVINAPGFSQITLTKKDLQTGSNYILVNLPPGEYTISRVRVLSNYYFSMKEDDWRFKIAPQSINYAGNFKVRSKNWFTKGAFFEMVNESSIALEYLQEKFPQLLKRKLLRYVGPGQDDFYNFTLAGDAVQQ